MAPAWATTGSPRFETCWARTPFAPTPAALRRELADAIILSADLPDGTPVEIDLVLDDPQLAGQ